VSVPGYEILGEVTRHSAARIYRAREMASGREVHLEVFHAWPLERQDLLLLERRRRVLEAVALLEHPNIWPVLRLGEHDRALYFVRPAVEGPYLDQVLRRQPPAPTRAVAWARQLALALQHAHEHGIFHADVKPSNVLMDKGAGPERVPLLTGFDTAVVLFLPPPLQESGDGTIMGTPMCMSPEQATGRRPDVGPGVDVWGLGVLLYQLLAGRPPFEGPNVLDLFRAVIERDPPPLRQLAPGVGRDLERIVQRCLRKKPEDRYATAGELAEELARHQRGEGSARPALAGRLGAWVRGWWG
jgi:serine/threonine protein kinase